MIQRDTLRDFPQGYNVCVTNPPWLARNSASRRGLWFPNCPYQDLYQYALKKCLDHVPYVAALVPESFLTANILTERLSDFISLTSRMFQDTGHPTGLALFLPLLKRDKTYVWSDNEHLGSLQKLLDIKPKPHKDGVPIIFNHPHGNLGLIAVDDTNGPTIRFCEPQELDGYDIKSSSRYYTRILTEGSPDIEAYNALLNEIRKTSQDLLLTAYRGIRKDGRYRRRLDWDTARGIIHHVTRP